MSSSYSEIPCPQCGQGATRVQDNDTLDIHDRCNVCGWETGDVVSPPEKVVIAWSAKDIEVIRPDWSPECCQKALDIIGKRLQERSVELGWDVITILLNDYREEIEDE